LRKQIRNPQSELRNRESAVVRSDASLTSLPSSDNLFYVFAPPKTLRKNIKNLLSNAVRSGSLALRRLAAARTPRRSLARLSFGMAADAMADVENRTLPVTL